MTRIDIFSGFLGAGKTTLIKKLLKEAYAGQKVVLIENEFGEIGIDGGFIQDAGIRVTEMNSGCICCSLVGDFGNALRKVLAEYHPDRILIEPSGVGKLSDVIKAASNACSEECMINICATVVDAGKCRIYINNFGEFFIDQISHASVIVLSRTDIVSEEKTETCISMIRQHNPEATIITTPVESLPGADLLSTLEQHNTLHDEIELLKQDVEEHHHHDHDHECDDPECSCHHHHDDDDDDEHEHHHHHDHDHECDDPECDCHHHHDDDDDDEDEHEHHHHHDHDHECDDPECSCHHHHEGHHHADDVFTSWGRETARKFDRDTVNTILAALDDKEKYGFVLRAKGIIPAKEGNWIHFDYTPGEIDIRTGSASVTGRFCVIGSGLKTEALEQLFGC